MYWTPLPKKLIVLLNITDLQADFIHQAIHLFKEQGMT
jgi:hypothetical protein